MGMLPVLVFSKLIARQAIHLKVTLNFLFILIIRPQIYE